jgi:hypothetical protein
MPTQEHFFLFPRLFFLFHLSLSKRHMMALLLSFQSCFASSQPRALPWRSFPHLVS